MQSCIPKAIIVSSLRKFQLWKHAVPTCIQTNEQNDIRDSEKACNKVCCGSSHTIMLNTFLIKACQTNLPTATKVFLRWHFVAFSFGSHLDTFSFTFFFSLLLRFQDLPCMSHVMQCGPPTKHEHLLLRAFRSTRCWSQCLKSWLACACSWYLQLLKSIVSWIPWSIFLIKCGYSDHTIYK